MYVCVYVCVCVCVCVCTCIYVYMFVHLYIHTHIYFSRALYGFDMCKRAFDPKHLYVFKLISVFVIRFCFV